MQSFANALEQDEGGSDWKRRKSKVKINFAVLVVVVLAAGFVVLFRVPARELLIKFQDIRLLSSVLIFRPPSPLRRRAPWYPLWIWSLSRLMFHLFVFLCWGTKRTKATEEQRGEEVGWSCKDYPDCRVLHCTGSLFSLFDACLLISGGCLHCVPSGGHCLALQLQLRRRLGGDCSTL